MTTETEYIQRITLALAKKLPPGHRYKARFVKNALARALTRRGWYVREDFYVPNRGTEDASRGRLGLIAWPPLPPCRHQDPHFYGRAWPHLKERKPPVLIEFGRRNVRRGTRAKFAAFQYRHSGTVVILTLRTRIPEQIRGIDTLVWMGA